MGLLAFVANEILSLPLPVLLALAVFVIFSYLVIKYPDRAIGTRSYPKFKPSPIHLPLVGDLPFFAATSAYRLEALEARHANEGSHWRATVPTPKGSWSIFTCIDVKDVEAVLRDPWLWIKGDSNDNLKDLLGEGIFAVDGDSWHSQRKTASHVFNVKNFRDVFSGDFNAEVSKAMEHLQKAHDLNASIDMQDLMLRCTLDSFGRVAMGSDFGCIKQQGHVEKGRYVLNKVAFMEAFDFVQNQVASRLDRPYWRLSDKLTGTEKKIREAQKVMSDTADSIIEAKEKKIAEGNVSEDDYKDMLQHFMNTVNFDGGRPTREQLRDTCMNLIIAGRDTTAQTLTWVFYELSKHPDKAQKAREEALNVLGPDGECTYESFKQLKYCTAVFNETLRIHANVPLQLKQATKDTVLPSGLDIKAGEFVMISGYVMGRSESIWGPDAKEFKPERWFDSNGNLKAENQYKWPVFNGGKRLCLGQNMATQEAVTILSSIIRKYRLKLVNEDDPNKWGYWHPDPDKRKGRYSIALTLGIRGGMDFEVEPV